MITTDLTLQSGQNCNITKSPKRQISTTQRLAFIPELEKENKIKKKKSK